MYDPSAWYVVLRDIMVILAAAVVVVTSAFVALIAWRLYRIGRELQHDVEPIVDSVGRTAKTVRSTTEFMGSGAVSPLVSVIGATGGLRYVVGVVDQARRRARREKQASGGS